MTPEELSRRVREAFAYLARYLSLLARSESANQLLVRPDVDAVIAQTLDEAAELTRNAVRQAWAENHGPLHSYLSWLIDDVDRNYELVEEIRKDVRRAAAGGELAVRGAVLDVGAHAALRSQLILHVAGTAAQTMREIENGTAEQMAGAHVWKQWRCSYQPPDNRTCHWCRALNNVVVPLHGNFPLGSPADLTGHGHLTQPPRAYHHVLQGPPRHPRCRCHIVILTNLPVHQVSSQAGGQGTEAPPIALPEASPRETSGYLAAADVRAMPEEKYSATLHFLRAAVHELRQLLARLRKVEGE